MLKSMPVDPDHYAALVEWSQDAIVGRNLDGIIESWNPAAEKIFGYSREEAVGQPMTLIIPPERVDEEVMITETVSAGKLVGSFETVRRHKSGREIDVSVTASAIGDAQGQITGTSRILRESTDRKQAGRQIRDSLREITNLKTALDEHAIVAITDPKGDIIYVNDKFCVISKYSREELLRQNHRVINSNHHPPEFFEDLWLTIAAGKVWKGEIKNRAKDGSNYWVDTTIVPFVDERGIPLQYVAIRADITQHKRALETLTARGRELEQSNAALQEFAYVASHDLQEPLRGLTGCVQLLQRTYSGQLDARADEFIRHAVVNVERMQALILALLDYSTINRRISPLPRVDCQRVLRETLENLSVSISESRTRVEAQDLPVIVADPHQLGRLFQNLIANAIKFRGSEPPVIEIAAHRGGPPPAGWTFTISDRGIGIDPQHAQRIFGVFQRLHTRGKYPGTGIGLAICRRIVERHGGHIWVEPRPGGGSVFSFTLPDGETAGTRE